MYNTDVQYINGQIVAKPAGNVDARRSLPEVKLTDRLGSTAWDVTIKSELSKYGYDTDPHLTDALDVQKRMAEMTQQFVARRNKQSPSETQYLHLKRLADDYNNATKQAGQSLDRARNGIKNRLESIQATFEDSLQFSMRDASDLRQVLRSATPEKRAEYIAQAVESGDGNLLAVVLHSHPVTVGLTAEMQQAYRNQTMQKHRPDLLALERNLKKADRLVFDSFDDMLTISDDLTASKIRQQYEKEDQEARSLATTQF